MALWQEAQPILRLLGGGGVCRRRQECADSLTGVACPERCPGNYLLGTEGGWGQET